MELNDLITSCHFQYRLMGTTIKSVLFYLYFYFFQREIQSQSFQIEAEINCSNELLKCDPKEFFEGPCKITISKEMTSYRSDTDFSVFHPSHSHFPHFSSHLKGLYGKCSSLLNDLRKQAEKRKEQDNFIV